MAAPARDRAGARWWFVTRKYPPAVGGMERLSYEVTQRLARRRPVEICAMHLQSRGWPWFMATTAFHVLFACLRGRITLLHAGDPLLAPVAAVARGFGVPTAITIHGLDVRYPNPLYRAYRRLFLRGFDAYICISEAAREAAIDAGVPAHRIHVIGIGIDVPPVVAPASAREGDRLLFVGRLVKRKGLAWFVANVLPRVAGARASLKLAILGDGPERAAVLQAAQGARVANRLVWLGAGDDTAKVAEFARATVCVMPNIAIDGDLEGFGIVALEAAAAGCPLLASDIEGLRDAVNDGESGRLVAASDADAWVQAISAWLDDSHARAEAGRRAREHAVRQRGWEPIIDRYERVLAGTRQRASPRE